MKPILMLAALGLMTACVSTTEYDRDRAYSKCDGISDESSKNRCIADAIQDAERDRHEQGEDLKRQHDEAEERELNREIAGARKDR